MNAANPRTWIRNAMSRLRTAAVGRSPRARNELEFLLISQPEQRGGGEREGLRATRRNSRTTKTPKSNRKLDGYWIFGWKARVLVCARARAKRKKRTYVAAKAPGRKSASQLNVIKLIGPRDNRANYRYQSTIAPRRYVRRRCGRTRGTFLLG